MTELKQKTLDAVIEGNQRRLRSLIRRGNSIHGSCSQQCVMKGNLECLQIVHENGGYWNEKTCSFAAFHGNLDCLRYAHENGCPWDTNTLSLALLQGHLDCAIYYLTHADDYQKDDPTYCKCAVWNGNIHCLKYLHQNGFAWDHTIPLQASTYGQTECLRYAIENGCPFSWKTCLDVSCVEYRAARNRECISYLMHLKDKIKAIVKIQAHVRGVQLRKREGVNNPHCPMGQRFLRRLFEITSK